MSHDLFDRRDLFALLAAGAGASLLPVSGSLGARPGNGN